MEFIDDGFGGDTDSADKDLGATFNDDIDELVQLSFCIVNLGTVLEGVQFNELA